MMPNIAKKDIKRILIHPHTHVLVIEQYEGADIFPLELLKIKITKKNPNYTESLCPLDTKVLVLASSPPPLQVLDLLSKVLVLVAPPWPPDPMKSLQI